MQHALKSTKSSGEKEILSKAVSCGGRGHNGLLTARAGGLKNVMLTRRVILFFNLFCHRH